MLGYAIVAADTVLAPVTPSSTARGAGTIYPILRNVPALYDSKPNDHRPADRVLHHVGGFVTTTNITSSLFLTALAPNLLAIEIVKRTTGITHRLDDMVHRHCAGRHLAPDRASPAHLLRYPPEIKNQRRSTAMG